MVLAYSQSTLDEVFDDGHWDDLLAQLTALVSDPNPDMAIVRAVVPKPRIPRASSATDRRPAAIWLFSRRP
jgi:5-methylcytosine-specific restriction protein B